MTQTAAGAADLSPQRAVLLDTLGTHRHFLRFAARDLTDEQAVARPTVSALCIGGIVKHVAAMEQAWVQFALGEPSLVTAEFDEAGAKAHADTFRLLDGETLAGVLAGYEQVSARTDGLVAGGVDLDAARPLPAAPWFPPGARWTTRRALLHVIAETAQHAGHADVIREAIDGQKTMG